MNNIQAPEFPNISLSHFELYVEDRANMELFYTRFLGFVVTDRGSGDDAMVFLSRNPEEHHQLVLNPVKSHKKFESPLDHISFRVSSLNNLRVFHDVLKASTATLQTVSHGNTWSIYFRDPENNRLELFTDTPWHVNQPCRFEIDFKLTNDELLKFTELKIKDSPGFEKINKWKESNFDKIRSTNLE